VIGAEATRELIAHYGGRQIALPVKASDSLVGLLGGSIAARLCDEFGGIQVYVPTEAKLQREERNRKIVEARRRGASYPELAREFNVTVRTVFYVIAAADLAASAA